MTQIRDHIEDANRHLDAAIKHHDEGSYHAARYRVGQAKTAVESALGTELSLAAAANPTAAMGAQGSDGQTDGSTAPRSAEAWAKRLFAPGRRR